jgi:hypothetical protein
VIKHLTLVKVAKHRNSNLLGLLLFSIAEVSLSF